MDSRLPALADLRNLCRSLAMLDAILSPERESRYPSFDANGAVGEEMASTRDGSGDEYSIVFSAAGGYVRGFGHETAMNPYGNGPRPPSRRPVRLPHRLSARVRPVARWPGGACERDAGGPQPRVAAYVVWVRYFHVGPAFHGLGMTVLVAYA